MFRVSIKCFIVAREVDVFPWQRICSSCCWHGCPQSVLGPTSDEASYNQDNPTPRYGWAFLAFDWAFGWATGPFLVRQAYRMVLNCKRPRNDDRLFKYDYILNYMSSRYKRVNWNSLVSIDDYISVQTLIRTKQDFVWIGQNFWANE